MRRCGSCTQTRPQIECTIAIVEDDPSYRHALERLLRASGFEAHTFASGEEFLGSAFPESHKCLILDIRLPGMSGFELFDHLTASAQPRPAIFITAQDEDRMRQQASRIPNSVYLRKPVIGAVLLEAVRSLLKRQRFLYGKPRPNVSPIAVHPIFPVEYLCTS